MASNHGAAHGHHGGQDGPHELGSAGDDGHRSERSSMSTAHSHGGLTGGSMAAPTGSAGARYKRGLAITLVLLTAYMALEATAGVLLNSLALISDAGHMLSDVAALAMSLAAIWFAQRAATPTRTYGFYRLEILAATLNSALLFLLGGWILYEAVRRFQRPPEILGLPMLLVAAGGLAVSFIGVLLLRKGAGESLNLQGAYLETLSDMLGFLGTIVAGAVIALTGWRQADPIAAVFIGLLILPRTAKLLKQAIEILLEATPPNVDVRQIEATMRDVPGVSSAHDLHVWTITSGFIAMSGHVETEGRPSSEVLHELQTLLHTRFGIEHATLQVERPGHSGDGICCTIDPRCLVVGGVRPLPHAGSREGRGEA